MSVRTSTYSYMFFDTQKGQTNPRKFGEQIGAGNSLEKY